MCITQHISYSPPCNASCFLLTIHFWNSAGMGNLCLHIYIFNSRLGNDRYKTKPIYETLNPKWLEQFDLSLIEGSSQDLEITVWDKDQRSKDDFMGRCSVGK